MLILGSNLENTPIMALQTGSQLAITGEPIIDPTQLKIVAYRTERNMYSDEELLIRIADIRELSRLGFIIDSGEDFINPTDVIKIEEIIKLDFHLNGIKVVDKNGKFIGKVFDYTLNLLDFTINQLIVKPSFFQRIQNSELTISCAKIFSIDNEKITIDSDVEEKPIHRKAPEDFKPNFINPFRD